MQTIDWKEQLTASAKTCRPDQAVLVEKLRDARQKVEKRIRKMGLESTYSAKQTAEKTLADTYYSRWLAASYPVVDLSFTESVMELLVERAERGARIIGLKDREPIPPKEVVANVARFAIQKDRGGRGEGAIFGNFPDPKCKLGAFHVHAFQLNREKFRDYSGDINCNRPEGSPKSLLRKLRDVSAIAMEARAAAVRAGINLECATFGRTILWLPRLEDLYITEQIPVRDDPAVLVTSGKHAHLVAFWDSPEENPIEGVLREFSEGSFDEVK